MAFKKWEPPEDTQQLEKGGTCISYIACMLCYGNPCGIEVCPYLLSDMEPPECEDCELNEEEVE